MISYDESPPPALSLSVVSSIDNTPLYSIAFLIEAPENNGEIPSALLCRGAYQPVHIFKYHIARTFFSQDIVYLPPEDTFFALDACGVLLHYRIVLAGETSHKKVVVGDIFLIDSYILAYMVRTFAEVRNIAIKRPLVSLIRLPLVCPIIFDLILK